MGEKQKKNNKERIKQVIKRRRQANPLKAFLDQRPECAPRCSPAPRGGDSAVFGNLVNGSILGCCQEDPSSNAPREDCSPSRCKSPASSHPGSHFQVHPLPCSRWLCTWPLSPQPGSAPLTDQIHPTTKPKNIPCKNRRVFPPLPAQ